MPRERSGRNHSKAKRDAPVVVSETAPTAAQAQLADEESLAPTMPTLISLLEQVATSTDPSAREFALSTLANATLDEALATELLQTRQSRVLLQALRDDSPGIRGEAYGALRNISCLGPDACARLLEDGVLESIAELFTAYPTIAALFSAAGTKEGQFQLDALHTAVENAAYLLHNLVEESTAAMAMANQCGLTAALLPYLDPASVPMAVAAACAQCVQTMSEDNPAVTRAVAADASIPTRLAELVQFAGNTTGTALLFRAAIAGILCNIHEIAPDSVLPLVLVTCAAVLSTDVAGAMASLAPSLAVALQPSATPDLCPPRAQLDSVQETLRAQQSALETLANFICSLDASADEGWANADDDGDDDDDDDEDKAAEDGADGMDAGNEAAVGVLQMVSAHSIPTLAAGLAGGMPAALVQVYRGHGRGGNEVLKLARDVQTRALALLNNFISVLPLSALSPEFLAPFWTILLETLAAMPADASEDFVESLTRCLWAITRKASKLPELLAQLPLAPAHVALFLSIVQTSPVDEARLHCVGLLGNIALLPALQPCLGDIGQVLLATLPRDNSGWVVAEILNSVFDVFAEPEVNGVVRALDMVTRLAAFVPELKTRLRDGRRSMPRDMHGRLDEAKLNLARFLKYKRQQF